MLQVITLIIVALLVAVDQLIKLLVIEHLEPIGSLPLIDDIIRLKYAENTGAAFGSFSEKTSFLSVFTLILIVAGIAYLFLKKRKVDFEYVCITLIVAGGLGNLIDRVFRGFVVDYIEPLFIDFAIFNFADILVTCSCIAYAIWMFYDVYRDCKKEKGNNHE
jgi:signal peptidase II